MKQPKKKTKRAVVNAQVQFAAPPGAAEPTEQELQRRRVLVVAAVAKQEFEKRFAPPAAPAPGPNLFAARSK